MELLDMYIVKIGFHDLQDGFKTKDGVVYHYYSPGDEYPRKGKTANRERIASLSSSDNNMGIPLIESIYKSENTETTTETKETVLQETDTTDTKETQKQKTATKRKRTTRTKKSKETT